MSDNDDYVRDGRPTAAERAEHDAYLRAKDRWASPTASPTADEKAEHARAMELRQVADSKALEDAERDQIVQSIPTYANRESSDPLSQAVGVVDQAVGGLRRQLAEVQGQLAEAKETATGWARCSNDLDAKVNATSAQLVRLEASYEIQKKELAESRREVDRLNGKIRLNGDMWAADLRVSEERRRKLLAVEAGREDVWFWQGDGDRPESLSCPVVMSPDTLRQILAKAAPDTPGSLTYAAGIVRGLVIVLTEIANGREAIPAIHAARSKVISTIPEDKHAEYEAARKAALSAFEKENDDAHRSAQRLYNNGFLRALCHVIDLMANGKEAFLALDAAANHVLAASVSPATMQCEEWIEARSAFLVADSDRRPTLHNEGYFRALSRVAGSMAQGESAIVALECAASLVPITRERGEARGDFEAARTALLKLEGKDASYYAGYLAAITDVLRALLEDGSLGGIVSAIERLANHVPQCDSRAYLDALSACKNLVGRVAYSDKQALETAEKLFAIDREAWKAEREEVALEHEAALGDLSRQIESFGDANDQQADLLVVMGRAMGFILDHYPAKAYLAKAPGGAGPEGGE